MNSRYETYIERSKITVVTILAMALAAALFSPLIGFTSAQVQQTSTNTTSPLNSTATATATKTFSAEGLIGSLVQDPLDAITLTGENSSRLILVPKLPYVLTGGWDLDVNDGNVTKLVAEFDMVHIDGTDRHSHLIDNFRSVNITGSIGLVPDATTLITGIADVKMDAMDRWTNVPLLLTIDKSQTMSISLDPNATGYHFEGQRIFGTTYSLTGEDGKQIVQ